MRVLCVMALMCLGVWACDEAGSGVTTNEAVEAGCVHFNFGEQTLLTASNADDASTPEVSVHHHRYVVTLVEQSVGLYAGYLDYAPTEAGRFLLMFSSDLPLVVTDAEGAVVAPVSIERALPECESAMVVYTLDLHLKVYTLHFEPVAAAGVTMVIHKPPVEGEVSHDATSHD